MTNDEKRLAQIVVGLYKVVRLQQESIAKMMVQSEALAVVLNASPELKQSFEAALLAAQASKTSQLLAAGLIVIDATIQQL